MTYKIPTQIETDRLQLCKLHIDHWPALHRYYADPEGTRYTTGKPLTEGESWRLVAALIGHWEIHGYGPYCLIRQSDAAVLGVCGLWFPGDWPEPEIKWALIDEYTGQGYASEAARAVQQVAARNLPDLHLISLIVAENGPSIQLAEAVGAEYEKDLEFRGKIARIYRHPAASSLSAQQPVQKELK